MLTLFWVLLMTIDYLRRPRIDTLLDQLAERGCQFQDAWHSLNPFTTYGVRHPEFACPIWRPRNDGARWLPS